MRSKFPMGLMIGTLLGMGLIPPNNPPKRRDYEFTDKELEHLATLSGKEKKKYVKELRREKRKPIQEAVIPGAEVALLQPPPKQRLRDS